MKLGTRTALQTTSIVLISAAAILVTSLTLIGRDLKKGVYNSLESRVERRAFEARAKIDALSAAVLEIATGPALREFLTLPNEQNRRRLEERLSSAVQSHPGYMQARFLDHLGVEVARVDSTGGVVSVASLSNLQNKSDREYFSALHTLDAGEIYFSPIDLNRENGVFERPLRPTLRVATAVRDHSGDLMGGVVINVEAGMILPPRHEDEFSFIVVGATDAFLLHENKTFEHGIELRTGISFESLYGGAAVDLLSSSRGIVDLQDSSNGDESLLTAYEWISPTGDRSAASWVAIASLPTEVALAPVRSRIYQFVLLVSAIGIFSCALGWGVALKTVNKVSELSSLARKISAGDRSATACETGSDEVADLARAFNQMTGKLDDLLRREEEARLQIEAVNKELHRSNEELESYAYATAHDLKSPLRALRVLPVWISEELEGIAVPDSVTNHLNEMEKRSKRLDELVDGLMRYSTVCGVGSQPEIFSAQEAIDRGLKTISPPNTFKLDVRCTSTNIYAVRTEIELIVRNLVGNSIKHHDLEGGLIKVSIDYGNLDGLVIVVEDDGPGIHHEDKEKILKPLVTLKSKDEGAGSGLGLAIVDKIVKRWSGSIEIHSDPPVRGSRFVVRFPISAMGRPYEAGLAEAVA